MFEYDSYEDELLYGYYGLAYRCTGRRHRHWGIATYDQPLPGAPAPHPTHHAAPLKPKVPVTIRPVTQRRTYARR